MSLCSVVMVSYHTGPVLFPAIRAVLAQRGLERLILVNNGNPPEAEGRLHALAQEQPEKFLLLSGHGNVGFARGCNLGVERATGGGYLLLLNPDCLLPPDALMEMMDALSHHPGLRLAGCNLVNADGTPQRGSRRQLLSPRVALSESLGLHRLLRLSRLNEHASPVPGEVTEVPAISGACMFLRLADYRRVGGMDEGFFLHVEDLDFCQRIHDAGGRVLFVPQVKVAHLCGTSRATSLFIEWQKARGFLRYAGKHWRGKLFPGGLWLARLGILLRFCLKSLLADLRSMGRRRAAHEDAPAKKLLLLHRALERPPAGGVFSGKTVLITGATGPLGLAVTGRLLAGGAAVLALSRDASLPFAHAHLRWLKGDLEDRALSAGGLMIDAVIHCAPLWLLPDRLEMMARAGATRVVAFGSTSVFGKADSEDPAERRVAEKLLTAEHALARTAPALGMEWTLLRPTLIYGVGLDENVSRMARFIRRFGVLPVFPPAGGRRQPVHLDDLAQAALTAAAIPAAHGRSYNVSGGETLTYRQMAERVFAALGKKPRLLDVWFLPRLLDMLGRLRRGGLPGGAMARRMNQDLVFFHDDAARDFGYAPRSFLSGGAGDLP